VLKILDATGMLMNEHPDEEQLFWADQLGRINEATATLVLTHELYPRFPDGIAAVGS
jgi:ABC-type nitrate/sulfonate/bicarbonate transport system substrate-binding protein